MSTYQDVVKTILGEIKKVQDADAIIATLVLTYIAIDTMSFLNMSPRKEKNGSKEFIDWVKKYMKTDNNQPYKYIGKDMWAARCGKLHSYSSFSNYAEKNDCSLYGYHSGCDHEYDSRKNKRLVIISVPRLVNDFGEGLMAFFTDISKDKELKKRVDSRIGKINIQFDLS